MTAQPYYGTVLECSCGGGKPNDGWFAPPMTFYCHCPACGEWSFGENATAAAITWNKLMLTKGRAAA